MSIHTGNSYLSGYKVLDQFQINWSTWESIWCSYHWTLSEHTHTLKRSLHTHAHWVQFVYRYSVCTFCYFERCLCVYMSECVCACVRVQETYSIYLFNVYALDARSQRMYIYMIGWCWCERTGRNMHAKAKATHAFYISVDYCALNCMDRSACARLWCG